MRTRLNAFLPLVASLLGLFIAAEQGQTADIAAGKEKAEGCTACHGADGISQTPFTPSLAGEPDDFTQWQLVYFRSGARKSDIMGPIAQTLSNEDIRNLGAYYASLPPPKPQAATDSDALAETGAKLVAIHRCKSCHGTDFAGYLAAARLAGQREDVLFKALGDFKSGLRVGSGVASMTDVVYGLNEDEMRALAHFLATRP